MLSVSSIRFTLIVTLILGVTATAGGAKAQAGAFHAYAFVQAPSEQPQSESDKTAIRPFQLHIPDEALADLRKRILATRWPDKETVPDQTQGPQLATMQKLAKYWANDYDWRKFETKLNSLPMFVTNIDGEDIQFIHVKSKHEGALPILLMHGWPGSIVEMLKIIDPLTNPTAYGGKASDAFDVVIPSMPGHGFSSKPSTTGWTPDRIAKAYAE
ncbi:epoxide hydrolase-like protein [Paenibacillus taihuensis]|uniref:Epoxide hydrolase-like protein n=1 Tax=Paenibacillus taihuensis TaxID=1156355 RepID=A0A3D9RTZ3_9BACL|nr:epoxide hydrolase N-terminal domain-containing protein [Paenibacillus taihuensis]REE80182.1 epoxide hydrolase-like protein [Paenibacillus taihuensis]